MIEVRVSLPEKWGNFLRSLANDHEIDLERVMIELCEWAFNVPESKKKFRVWLDAAYPLKEDVEEGRAAEEDAAENEEEEEEETEEESHDHRD